MPDPVVSLLTRFSARDWTLTGTGPEGHVVLVHAHGASLHLTPLPEQGIWSIFSDGHDLGSIPRLNRDVMDDLKRALAPHGQVLIEAWRMYMKRVCVAMELPPGPWRWIPAEHVVTPNPTEHLQVSIPAEVAQYAVAELAPYVVYERPSIIMPPRFQPAHLGLEIRIPRTARARQRLMNSPQFAG